jgi:hypothetical protein
VPIAALANGDTKSSFVSIVIDLQNGTWYIEKILDTIT